MDFLSILLVAVSLSMDALAVALSTGMCVKENRLSDAVRIGIFLRGFQFGMPVVGWLLGRSVASSVRQVDHWIAFGLLLFIGGKCCMRRPGALRDEESDIDPMAASGFSHCVCDQHRALPSH
jgi:putative Mn2+ efflux pump MntP